MRKTWHESHFFPDLFIEKNIKNIKSFLRIAFVWILSRIEYCHVSTHLFNTLDSPNIFFVLFFDRYISRNLTESANKLCGQKLALLAPCSHCRFRELKFSIRKYVIVVLANGRRTMQRTTAEEVEETDIPGISVDSQRLQSRLQPWISSLTIVIQWQALEHRTVCRVSRFFMWNIEYRLPC